MMARYAVGYYKKDTDSWVLDAPRFETVIEAEGYAALIEINGYGEQAEIFDGQTGHYI